MDIGEFVTGLPVQFDKTVPGRVLLLDGDFLAYSAAATVKTLPTALRRFHTLIETQKFMTGADEVRVHLTARGCTKCNRYLYPTVQTYQDNRKGKAKPPLLEPLRMASLHYDWPDSIRVFLWHEVEADDALMMDAVYYGKRAVMSSGDKDLGISPCPLWNAEYATVDVIEDRFGWIDIKEMSHGWKVFGHGTKFFWAQMLMGDTADHVKGITKLHGKACGPVGTYEFMNHITNERDCAIAVLRAYAQNKQDPLAEAECLWLHRTPTDSAYMYFKELNLPDVLATWIDQLHEYHEQVLKYKFDIRDSEHGEVTETTVTGSQTSGNDDSDLPPWSV